MKFFTRARLGLFFVLFIYSGTLISHAMERIPETAEEYYNQYMRNDDTSYNDLSRNKKKKVKEKFKKWKESQANVDEPIATENTNKKRKRKEQNENFGASSLADSKSIANVGSNTEADGVKSEEKKTKIITISKNERKEKNKLDENSTPEEVINYYNQENHKSILTDIAKGIFLREKDKVANNSGRGETIGHVANKMCTHNSKVVELWKFHDTKYSTMSGEEKKEKFGISGRQFNMVKEKDQLNVFSEDLQPQKVLDYISAHIDEIFTGNHITLEQYGKKQNLTYRISVTFPYENSGMYYASKESEGVITNSITIHLYVQDIIPELLKGTYKGIGDSLGSVTTICPSL